MGRPSKDLHVVIGVLLLQQLHDLSDAETVEALAFNMAWHYALDVRSEADSYFCEKTLRNYRRLFIEQGLDELLFRCLTDRMVQGFSVDTSHQRMDSTALRSAMRALTRLGIVVESISKFARELERYHPGLHEQISKEVIRRYVDREGNGAFANTAPSVSKRRLGEAGQDLLALVLQFRDTAAAKLSSFAILERVLRDQFEIVDDECGDRDAKRAAIRDPKDVPCDTVGNPADPDASYNAHKGQGYPVRRVPLLARHVRIRVRLQDRVDDAGEPVQLGPPDRLRPAVARRRRIAQHLLHRPAVDPEPPTGLVMAQTLLDNRQSNRRIELHAVHPPPRAKTDKGP